MINFFDKNKRKKQTKKNTLFVLEYKLFKITMSFVVGLTFIAMLPFIILAAPFVLAWDAIDVVHLSLQKKEKTKELPNSQWMAFTSDFSKWFNNKEEN